MREDRLLELRRVIYDALVLLEASCFQGPGCRCPGCQFKPRLDGALDLIDRELGDMPESAP